MVALDVAPNDTRNARDLRGVEVTITGRLASMRRDEAVERIELAGGTYHPSMTATTRVVVVGQGGPPLGDDGRPTRTLRTARRMQARGLAVEIIGEDEFLARLGADDRASARTYTTAQLARILDVPQSEIRSWVRNKLIEPVRVVHRLCFFEFRQVAGAKELSRLKREGVSPYRIRKSLRELEGWWPGARRSLAQLEALEEKGPLVMRTDDGALVETNGQLRLDFDALPALPPPRRPDAGTPARSIERREGQVGPEELWFRRGLRLEEEDRPEEAVVAYANALEFGNPRPELAFNLGNLMYGLERNEDAARCFALATEIEPEYVEAWNNLGNSLCALERPEEALDAFARAIELAPDYADAHFNLGETLADLGRIDEAREHWEAYLADDPYSEWADEVRARLRRTGGPPHAS